MNEFSGDHLPSRVAEQHHAIWPAAAPSLLEARRPTDASTEPRSERGPLQWHAAAPQRSTSQRA